jgi:hypothetical protein
MAIGLIEQCDDQALLESFRSRDGKQLTAKEIRSELSELRERGFIYYPSCDNYGPDGACLGHEKE